MKAHVIDSDLLSVQEARVLVESAKEAQKKLVTFSQEDLDMIVEGMLEEVGKYLDPLGWLAFEETGFGNVHDKAIKNKLFCKYLKKEIRDMKCVGIIEEDFQNGTIDIGVPLGVIASFASSIDPVSTVIYEAVISIKAGNAIVFSPHPNAENATGRTIDILKSKAESLGMPSGALSYLSTVSAMGSTELINNRHTSLIMVNGSRNLQGIARKSDKPVVSGGETKGIVFIEQSADVRQAVEDIVFSKAFDNGLMTSAENMIVVERSITDTVKKEFSSSDAYFLNEHEYGKLENLFLVMKHRSIIGKSAYDLAEMAGFKLDKNIKLLIIEQKYVNEDVNFEKWQHCPVIPYYVEDDWQGACEKCIELLFEDKSNNTLIIHSQNECIIRLFALNKPVSRVLVNTPAILGNMGITTNLFPIVALSSNKAGMDQNSSAVTPMDLINVRRVGYGTRKKKDVMKNMANDEKQSFGMVDNLEEEKIQQIIKQLLLDNKY